MLPTNPPPIFSVTELNNMVKTALEDGFPVVWVKGEMSGLVIPSSGHAYFSLKDQAAQVRCVMFKSALDRIKSDVKNGMQVVISGKIGLYTARGEYQLIVSSLKEKGEGDLQIAFEKLKQKLAAEGLFSAEIKKALPKFPKAIGIITSPTGAAVHDVLNILQRRYPLAEIIIYPTLVQGTEAISQIIAALSKANQDGYCDLLLLIRGGGSPEDLWCFNEEAIVRAIFASKIPIITGIGHEIDFTLSDFAADYRAPTPSAAAEIAVPDRLSLLQQLDSLEMRLYRFHPEHQLKQQREKLQQLKNKLFQHMHYQCELSQQKLASLSRALHGLSPLITLGRGYALLSLENNNNNKIIESIENIKPHDLITAQLKDGKLHCLVRQIEKIN